MFEFIGNDSQGQSLNPTGGFIPAGPINQAAGQGLYFSDNPSVMFLVIFYAQMGQLPHQGLDSCRRAKRSLSCLIWLIT